MGLKVNIILKEQINKTLVEHMHKKKNVLKT